MEKSETPGLKRFPRKDGTERLIWSCSPQARKAGFRTLTANLSRLAGDEAALKLRCQSLDAQQRMFLSGGNVADVIDLTVGGIIQRYMKHPESPFHGLQLTTQKPYAIYAAKIIASVGTRRIEKLTGLDVMRWHKAWREPDATGQPEKLGAATMALAVFTSALSFAVSSGVVQAATLLTMIRETDFPKPRPRTEAPDARQIEAARKAAHDLGHPGAALAYALQFDGALRQYDVIGKWVPLSDPRPSDIIWHDLKWVGPRWSDVKAGILEWTPQKTADRHGKAVRLLLADYPMITEELRHVPADARHGPLVKAPDGEPYKPDAFRKLWVDVRRKAGLASTLWNRDFRAGAITEGSNSGVSTDDLAKVAANSPRVNRNVYQRDQFEAARRVAAARKEGRG